MKKLVVRHYKKAAVILIICLLLWYVPSGYIMTSPGSAIAVSPMIQVDGEYGDDYQRTHDFMLTTVMSREANLAVALFGFINPRAELRPRTQYVDEDEDFEDYLERTRRMMRESQETAIYVAMKESGFEPDINGDGVEVVSIREDSPAKDILKTGDIIKGAANNTTKITDDLLDVVGRYDEGDEIELRLKREGNLHEVTVPLMQSPDNPEDSIIGIGVVTKNMQFSFPFDVNIDSGNIGGPSAGLAFSLSLIDMFLPEWTIDESLNVACTGSVNTRGEIGSVGGVTLKAWAAERAGADVFMVPDTNYQDALDAETNIKIVPVETIQEAVDFFHNGSVSNNSNQISVAA